ncbi:MAG: SagB/ThcOx family dehydrogenase [Verrucomicrobiales bacterium]|nr:SagB/ThcOx family dehydrogenase [Verrucomicrobiota bacterium JB025]
MNENWRQICDDYVKVTSYDRATLDAVWEGRSYDAKNRPETYLTYPDALRRIPLGEPEFPEDTASLWKVFAERRSKRNFLPEALTLNELNVLLWSTQGITADMNGYKLRTSPSSGALFPLETYLLVSRVEGLEPGLYHLDVKGWALEALKFDPEIAETAYSIALDQEHCRHAAVTVLWTAVLPRCRAKYYERAYRYVWWDVGHTSENLNLAATGLGLGCVSMGAWYDKQAHELLGIDGKEHVSAMMASVGKVGGDWKSDRRAPSPEAD